jgi:hypothetical protein
VITSSAAGAPTSSRRRCRPTRTSAPVRKPSTSA